MRIIFAGTPEFAAVALRALTDSGHDVALVLTQPDRPGGRGMQLQPSPVKRVAGALGIPVAQPSTLRDAAAQAMLAGVGADVMIVAAYGLILPQGVLDQFPLGCLNIHASLLPRWRGAAPIQRAIAAGDAETGVCLMQMEAGLDTGPVLARVATPIEAADTAGSLHDRLAGLGARLLVDALAQLPLPAERQSDDGATYAAKIEKGEALIDWRHPALAIDRKIRALNPFPGAQTMLDGSPIKIWQARLVAGSGSPGSLLTAGREGIVVACGEGALALTVIQKAGGKRLSAEQFLAGHPLVPGVCFGSVVD